MKLTSANRQSNDFLRVKRESVKARNWNRKSKDHRLLYQSHGKYDLQNRCVMLVSSCMLIDSYF